MDDPCEKLINELRSEVRGMVQELRGLIQAILNPNPQMDKAGRDVTNLVVDEYDETYVAKKLAVGPVRADPGVVSVHSLRGRIGARISLQTGKYGASVVGTVRGVSRIDRRTPVVIVELNGGETHRYTQGELNEFKATVLTDVSY